MRRLCEAIWQDKFTSGGQKGQLEEELLSLLETSSASPYISITIEPIFSLSSSFFFNFSSQYLNFWLCLLNSYGFCSLGYKLLLITNMIALLYPASLYLLEVVMKFSCLLHDHFTVPAFPSSIEHKLHEDRGLCLLGSQFESSDLADSKIKQVLEE